MYAKDSTPYKDGGVSYVDEGTTFEDGSAFSDGSAYADGSSYVDGSTQELPWASGIGLRLTLDFQP